MIRYKKNKNLRSNPDDEEKSLFDDLAKDLKLETPKTDTPQTDTPQTETPQQDPPQQEQRVEEETILDDDPILEDETIFEEEKKDPPPPPNIRQQIRTLLNQASRLDPTGNIKSPNGNTWSLINEIFEDGDYEFTADDVQDLQALVDIAKNTRRPRVTPTTMVREDFDTYIADEPTSMVGYMGEVYKRSLQKDIFFKAQLQRSPKMSRFKKFEQFLPSTKAEGFRTVPLPEVSDFSRFAQDLSENPDEFYNVFGKYPFSEPNHPKWGWWSYFTSKYGKLTKTGKDKSSGIGTILILLRLNGHAQMVVPSITPVETSRTVQVWSPIAEFVSRLDLLGFESDKNTATKMLKSIFPTVDETLVEKLSSMSKLFNDKTTKSNATSGFQMLRYIRSWKQSKPSALQRRMVMPILVFEEMEDDSDFRYSFKFSIKGSSFVQPYQVEMATMAESMRDDDVATTSAIPEEVRKKIQEWAKFTRNNPILGAPMGRRSRKRVKRRR